MNDPTAQGTSPLNSILFFLAGGLAGAGVALLMAPQSGQATRDMLRQGACDTADSARELKNRVVRRGQNLKEEARQRVSGAVSALGGDGAEQRSL